MKILNEHLYTNNNNGAFRPLTVTGLRDFITENVSEAHRARTFVKAMKRNPNNGIGGFDVYDVYFENNNVLSPTTQASACIVQTTDSATAHELTVATLLADLEAVIANDDGVWSQLEMKICPQTNTSRLDGVRVMFEDRTNTLFLVYKVENDDWTYLRNSYEFLTDITRSFSTLTPVRLDKAAARHVIESMIERFETDDIDNAVVDDDRNFQHNFQQNAMFTARLLPPSEFSRWSNTIQQVIERTEAETPDETPNETPTAETPAETPAEAPAETADTAPNETPSEEPSDEVANEAPVETTDEGENVNGIVILGEYAGAEDDPGREPDPTRPAVMMSVKSLDEIKAELRAMPRAAVEGITKRPVVFKQINPGTPTNETRQTKTKDGKVHTVQAGLYNQVYRSYKSFFVFESYSRIVWKQVKTTGKTERPMILSAEAVDKTAAQTMYQHMLAQSGNMWVPEFYNTMNGTIRSGLCKAVWDPTGYIAGRARESKPGQTDRMSDEKKLRLYREQQILNRLMTQFVPLRMNFRGGFKTRSDDKYFIAPVNRNHQFTERHAILLAKHFDDWSYSLSGGRFINTLTPLMAFNDIVPPRENEKIELTQEESEKLERTVTAAKSKLGAFGLDIQITVPGHLPKYNFIAGEIGTRQGSGWPKDDNRYFAVMFPGLTETKFFGDDAKKLLSDTGIWSTVEQAFAEAEKEYPGIIPAVCADNGMPA